MSRNGGEVNDAGEDHSGQPTPAHQLHHLPESPDHFRLIPRVRPHEDEEVELVVAGVGHRDERQAVAGGGGDEVKGKRAGEVIDDQGGGAGRLLGRD